VPSDLHRLRRRFSTAPASAASRLALATLLAILTLSPALGQIVPVSAQASTVSFSTAEAAPADAFAYIVTTTDDESEQWRLADVLLDRAGLGDVIDEAMAEELSDDSGEELPLDAFLGGEVGVVANQALLDAAIAESMSDPEFEAMFGSMGMATPEAAPVDVEGEGVAAVIDARAPDTAWAGLREAILEEEGNAETTYEGTTILYAPPAADDEEDEGMAAARVGDLIVVGVHPVDLEPVIDTAEGRTPAITTVPEFTTSREALPAEFLMFAFTNSSSIMDTELGALAMMAGGSAAAFSGVTIAADEAGFRMESVALPTAGETATTATANFDSELVALAPPDTVFFASGADLGATGVLDAVGATMLAAAFGMGGAGATPDPDVSMEDFIAEQYEMAASLIGINLQTEFFQQFSGEYGSWLSAGPEDWRVGGLFATGTSDPDAVANALMQLSFIIQGASGAESPLTTREIGGGQVYVVELDDAGSTLEFGVVGDRLVIGSGDAVSRLEGEPEESLADNTRYQAVMDTLPVERNGLVYVDLERAIPLLEAAAEETEDMGLGGFEEFPDASESCADYASQEEAQAAYDAAESGTFDLDQDFDGEVCEDFYTTTEPSVAVEDEGMLDEKTAEIFENIDYSAIQAYAQVSYDQDGLARSSAILYIAE
jgi:hypothetical protein